MSGSDDQPAAAAVGDDAPQKRPDARNEVNASYAVKVKPEHVLSERPACLAPPPPASIPLGEGGGGGSNGVDGKGNNGNGGDDNDDKRSKRSRNGRGQNKKRPRDARMADGEKACLAVVRGQTCPYEGSEKGCKYNHDLKAMLASRPADIGREGGEGTAALVAAWLGEEGCPFWRMNGYCDFGIMCRLGSCHVNMSTGQNLCRSADEDGNETIGLPPSSSSSSGAGEPKVTADGDAKEGGEVTAPPPQKPGPGAVLGHQGRVMNILSKDTQVKLRKNSYPFVCKRHFEDKKGGKNRTSPAAVKAKRQPQMPPVVRSTTTPELPRRERKLIDFRDKVYIAPLTTVGNLPFRRVMKLHGADITCGEMAIADQLLSGKPAEWALLKRHPSEDVFGVQIAAGHADQYTRVAEVIANEEGMEIDFVDMNLGCPIDLVCKKGAGASLMLREQKLRGSLEGMLGVLDCPVTIKIRTGWNEKSPIAHQLVPKVQSWGIEGIGAFMIHGRSRLQRYSRLANWDYISKVACSQSPDRTQIPFIGNGDIFSYTDYEEKILSQIERAAEEGGDGGHKNNLLPTAMLGRGALIKPWLPTEIKERRHWDISASERLDMLKDFVRFGLEHWGSDQQGVNHTRRFLLEWLSFLHRYVPVGMLEVIPQHMNQRPPNNLCGRSDLETMMLSKNCADWIKISEMLLGPVPEGFLFEPKHKANSYA